jgi:large conductance mechanosensitive channel protein
MKKLFNEFKTFISKGNAVELAIGVIIGGAFTTIINSLVTDIFTPIISIITGKIAFEHLVLVIGSGSESPIIAYGNFLTAVINFILTAIALFLLIKVINKARNKQEPAKKTKTCLFCKTDIHIDATRCPNCTSEVVKN